MVPPEEDIARAICSNHWDAENNLISGSLFKGSGTSVSRLAVTPLPDTWDLFRQNVESPPERILMRIGTINVGELQEIGRKYLTSITEITVEPRPEPGYESHAEIPQKITRGLSNEIIKALNVHIEAGSSTS
jgi:hypothetical protein